MHHLHFNHLAILVAALIQWVLGALWYSLFFRKPWMQLTGHTKAEKPKGMVFSMVWSFIGGLILSFVLAHVRRAGLRMGRIHRLPLLVWLYLRAALRGNAL